MGVVVHHVVNNYLYIVWQNNLRSYIFSGGSGDNLFVILYTSAVVLVWMIEYRHPTLRSVWCHPIFNKSLHLEIE